MSIQITTRVWERSTAHSGELLVLLAIADHANDDGWAWPGIDLLARKTRQSPRHVTRCITRLAEAGELKILAQQGPHGTNRYQVQCLGKPEKNPVQQTPTCQGDIACQGDGDVPRMSPKPSEPSAVLTHTLRKVVGTDKNSWWPPECLVIEYAAAYPGNMLDGIPAGAITERWAKDYWSWRTLDEGRWPKNWPKEMVRRFEKEWDEGKPAARGIPKKNARGANGRPAGWQEGDAEVWWTDSFADLRSAINGAALGGDEKTVARLRAILALREKETH